MQIFVLDTDVVKCAQYHCNKHVVSAIKEHCQMLSTCHHALGSYTPEMLAPTHYNHPCNLWIRKSLDNYNWLCELTLELCEEKRIRFDTPHMYETLVEYFFYNKPKLPSLGLTEFALAMPPQYITSNDAVTSYRKYYIAEKAHFSIWTFGIPKWFLDGINSN